MSTSAGCDLPTGCTPQSVRLNWVIFIFEAVNTFVKLYIYVYNQMEDGD